MERSRNKDKWAHGRYQNDTKERKRKQKDPRADTTSRLTVPGPHSHPSTPKSRPKRCVDAPGECISTARIPSSGLRDATHGKQVVPPLSSSQRGQSTINRVTSPMRIEPRGHDKAGGFPGLF